jgi:hypothetical protein
MGMAMADTIKHNRTLQHFYLDALKKRLDAGEECVAYTHERLRASCEVVTQRRRKIMFSSPWEVVKREMVWYVVQLMQGYGRHASRCGEWHSFGFIFVSGSQDVPHAWTLSHGVVIFGRWVTP